MNQYEYGSNIMKVWATEFNIILRGRTVPLTSKFAFYIFIYQIQVLNILNMIYILLFFSFSKCSLFHNSNLFGSCIIHILYTGCAKIKKKIPSQNVYMYVMHGPRMEEKGRFKTNNTK